MAHIWDSEDYIFLTSWTVYKTEISPPAIKNRLVPPVDGRNKDNGFHELSKPPFPPDRDTGDSKQLLNSLNALPIVIPVLSYLDADRR